MNLTLYTVSDDTNVLNKTLGTGRSFNNITRYLDTDIINPSFEMLGSNYRGENYCYVTELNRYYYINNVIREDGGLVLLECSVDVLMSYKNAILGLTCNVARNEQYFNGYLPDNALPVYAYEEVVTKRFPNAMNNDSVILMTVG